jgi:hypothetical protein
MTQKAKPTIVDLLSMPDAAEIAFEIQKIDMKIIDEANIEELMKELTASDKPKSRQ